MRVMLGLVLATVAALGHAGDWRDRDAAVVLSYDDALAQHLDNVAPELERTGLPATFYVTVSAEGFVQRIDEWRALAARGHELGNHTMYHPCDGSLPGRDWVQPEYDLSTWSVQRMVDNLRMTSVLLQLVDGESERSFAYTCGDTRAGGQSFVEAIMPMFPAARGVQGGMQTRSDLDLYNLRIFSVEGHDAGQLTAAVDAAVASGSLLIFLFHGVGGGHSLNATTEAHAALLDYLANRRDQVWVATLRDVARLVSGGHVNRQ